MFERYYLGYDIGGSSVEAVLAQGQKIIKSKHESLPGNLEALLDLLARLKNELTDGVNTDEIGGAGFAIAGMLDLPKQKVLLAPNIGYLNNQPIKDLLEKKFHPLPVKIEHDVHCYLIAEKEIGLAKKLQDVFYLTLGTGIGGALMLGGKISRGSHGSGGEAGHMIMDLGTRLDFEEVAANKYITKILEIGAAEAYERAKNGDVKAMEIFRQLGRNLGVGLANIINIIDPQAIILSGGIAQAKEFYLSDMEEEMRRYICSPAARDIKILFSELGREAGALGAASLFNNPQID